MKKIIILLGVLFLFTGTLWAQSLQDNPDYRKSLDLKRQSEAAFEEGEYEEAKRLAEESLLYAKKSDEWIANMLARYRANSALRLVKDRLAQAAVVKAEVNYPEEYAQGKKLYNEAYDLFQGESYVDSREKSLEALEVLKVIAYVRSDAGTPAFYVVRLLPGNTDCLWNIAGYDFIYGNPWEWERLYQANKDKMPQSENPHLIFPDMVLTVPPLKGESRSGTWKDGRIQ